jgi:hypothetical protein
MEGSCEYGSAEFLPNVSDYKFINYFFSMEFVNTKPGYLGIVTMLRDGQLDNRGTVVRFPTGERNFYLLRSVQTCSGANPASYTMGIGGYSLRIKRPRREADHSPPSSAEVKNAGVTSPLPHTSSRHSA